MILPLHATLAESLLGTGQPDAAVQALGRTAAAIEAGSLDSIDTGCRGRRAPAGVEAFMHRVGP